MAPRFATEDQRRLRARQLLRFYSSSGSPYATKIGPAELEYAHFLQPLFDEDDPVPSGEEPWPPNWSTKRKSLPSFLGGWRKLLPHGSPSASEQDAASPASPTPTPVDLSPSLRLSHQRSVSAPSSSRVSVGSTPPSSTYDRNRIHSQSVNPRSTPEDDTDSEVAHDAESQPSEDPDSEHSDDMAPLTVDDAATLIGQAMEANRVQQNQDFAQLIAHAFQQHAPAQPHVNGDGRSSLRPADVGYFCPRKHSGSGVWSDGKITKYFDVFHFVERLKHLERIHSTEDVRRVWSQCLLEDALEWHSHVLTEADRVTLERDSVQDICKKLKARFAKSFSEAMASLKSDHLSLQQVAEGKDVISFLQTVISNARSCDMELPAQLIAAFESLAPEIKSELEKPAEGTSLETFLTNVRSRESVIVELARQRYPSAQGLPRMRQPTPAYGGRSTIPYTSRYPPSQPQRWQQPQRFQAQPLPFVPQYTRPYVANQAQNPNQFQLPMRPAGRGQIWNAGYSRPWLPPDQYAAFRRQQDEQRQAAPAQARQDGQRQPPLVPENRRLPAPQAPFGGGQNQRNQPQQAYHGDSADFVEQPDSPAYQQPFVEEAPDDEFSVEAASATFDYPFEEAFPQDEQVDYPDVGYFGTSVSTPSTCRYCMKTFRSNNALMDHVYSVHLHKPRPRGRNPASAFAAEATVLPAGPRQNSCTDGSSKDAPDGSVGTSTAKN